MSGLTAVDFVRDSRLTDDPHPFYEALRNKCPVTREDHYGVTIVTGWQEAVDINNDAETLSSCISPSPIRPRFQMASRVRPAMRSPTVLNKQRSKPPTD